MNNRKKDRAYPTRYEAYTAPFGEAAEPEVAPAESLVTPEEVIRNGVGETDVERLRDWARENQL